MKKFLIVDFDGVMNSFDETPGSYVTHGNCGYGASASCLQRLRSLAATVGASVVISSNWRKFDDDGPFSIWKNVYGSIQNPLPKFRQQIQDIYACDLPKTRHMRKADVFAAWMDDNKISESNTKFVIFDDDINEGFQDTVEHNIKSHFILTDMKTGLSDADVERAKELLS